MLNGDPPDLLALDPEAEVPGPAPLPAPPSSLSEGSQGARSGAKTGSENLLFTYFS